LRACAFRIEKMMSCLRERAMFSTPSDSASSTSLPIGIAFSCVRFIELRDWRQLRGTDDLGVVAGIDERRVVARQIVLAAAADVAAALRLPSRFAVAVAVPLAAPSPPPLGRLRPWLPR
jgi:hypothetical protein